MSDYALIVFHITPAVWNKSSAFAHKCSVYNIIAAECQSLSLFGRVCLDIISVNSCCISVLTPHIQSSAFAFVHAAF